MDVNEILYSFRTIKAQTFPKRALDAAIEQQEEITPILLDYIKITPPQLISIYEGCEIASGGQEADFTWYFAVNLLAQFRCTKAFKPIVEFFTFNDQELVNAAVDDFIPESLPGVLASVFDGDIDQLFTVIIDKNIDPYIRDAFLRASMILVMYDQLERKDTISRYIKIIEQEITEGNMQMVSLCVSTLSDLAEPELIIHFEKAYDKKLVDLTFFTRSDVDYVYDSPPKKGEMYYSMVDDCYQFLKRWAWFVEEPMTTSMPSNLSSLSDDYVVDTYQREESKIGRNDPCPCGSGKKYKKCCLH